MSLNSEQTKGADGAVMGGGGRGEQVPRLRAGGYAAYRPAMHAYLERTGASGTHTEAMTTAEWQEAYDAVAEWAQDVRVRARALALAGRTSSATASVQSASASSAAQTKASPQGAIDEETRAARRQLTADVERSKRAYGVIYASLPEELQSQADTLPTGWAFGIWDWLERKFQNTDADNIGNVWLQLTALKQADDETFDAYKARVDKLVSLLEHAKETVSRRLYGTLLVDKLLPSYGVVVSVLKLSEQWKNADTIPWEWVRTSINAHERNQLVVADAVGTRPWRCAWAASRRAAGRRRLDRVTGGTAGRRRPRRATATGRDPDDALADEAGRATDLR